MLFYEQRNIDSIIGPNNTNDIILIKQNILNLTATFTFMLETNKVTRQQLTVHGELTRILSLFDKIAFTDTTMRRNRTLNELLDEPIALAKAIKGSHNYT